MIAPQTTTEHTAVALSDLATGINREHQAAQEAAQTAVQHARRCGALLIEAKGAVGHGALLPWLGTHCHVKERQARNYMRIAENWPLIANRQRGADLTVRGALRLLSEDDEFTLPWGFTWNRAGQGIEVVAPSGCTMKLSRIGATFDTAMTKDEWMQFGAIILKYGEGLQSQIGHQDAKSTEHAA